MNVLVVDFQTLMLWEVGEQGNQAQGVVKVAESIWECWISLSYHMAERVLWPLFKVILSFLELFLAQVFLVFFQMRLDISKFI